MVASPDSTYPVLHSNVTLVPRGYPVELFGLETDIVLPFAGGVGIPHLRLSGKSFEF